MHGAGVFSKKRNQKRHLSCEMSRRTASTNFKVAPMHFEAHLALPSAVFTR